MRSLTLDRFDPPFESVLCLGAHPDDIEIRMGGTVARHVSLGDRVGLCDLAGREMGAQRGEQPGGGDACLGELLRLPEEAPSVQVAVDVGVEKNEQVLVEVLGCEARLHRCSLEKDPGA